jgi:hypothetical protein
MKKLGAELGVAKFVAGYTAAPRAPRRIVLRCEIKRPDAKNTCGVFDPRCAIAAQNRCGRRSRRVHITFEPKDNPSLPEKATRP